MSSAISDTTVSNILKAHGIEPAPSRKRTGSWETFLKAHWDVMAAIDFTTVEVWTKSGLTTFYLLFVMELKTRRVHFAGCSTSPHEAWMKNMARELTNCDDGFLCGRKIGGLVPINSLWNGIVDRRLREANAQDLNWAPYGSALKIR